MKILILSHTRNNSNFKIGSHHYANELSKEHDVTFIGKPLSIMHIVRNKKNKISYDKGSEQLNNNVKVIEFNPLVPISKEKKWKLEKINYLFYGPVKEIKKTNYDLIICDTPYFINLIKVIKHQKLIYRPTDDYFLMDGDNVILYEKEIIDKSSAIIATSNEVVLALKKRFKIPEYKIKKTISNGYDNNHFKCKSFSTRMSSVYAGALDKRFDFESLLKLALNNKDDIFNIYGPIDTYNFDKVEKIKSLCKNVNFYGPVKYNELPDILNKHKIGLLILSSVKENLGRSPMKLWEYLSCGLNILYSNIYLEPKVKSLSNVFYYENENELLEQYMKAKNYYSLEMNIDFYGESWESKAKLLIDECI